MADNKTLPVIMRVRFFMKIFKYEVPIKNNFVLELPIHCKILSFQAQNENLFIWVLVDTDKALCPRYFCLLGTGHDIDYHPDLMKYIGTVQISNGTLVWHLFENFI